MTAASTSPAPSNAHGELMDGVYRLQRHIYDVTRKYYLFGRDRLIERLDAKPGSAVLELACGTGRNLVQIGKRWPGVSLHGLDISSEMLKSASARLQDNARLACGDATRFASAELFGLEKFDRIILSYALSMIPDWQLTIDHALDQLAPGGSLHIVDFGNMRGLPRPIRQTLRAWLRHFHVTPRRQMAEFAMGAASRKQMLIRCRPGPLGYFQSVTITRR